MKKKYMRPAITKIVMMNHECLLNVTSPQSLGVYDNEENVNPEMSL